MRYDDNHKERTRARVLAEAAAAIRSKGAERVGVAEVMAGAGLTHGGFYAHFKSKDDLVAQAVTHMFDASYAWFLRHTDGREPADALSNCIDAYLAPSQREQMRLCARSHAGRDGRSLAVPFLVSRTAFSRPSSPRLTPTQPASISRQRLRVSVVSSSDSIPPRSHCRTSPDEATTVE
jgi:AcrR family transcriptional regulator